MDYPIEVVLRGSFRTSRLKETVEIGEGAAVCVLISSLDGSDALKVQDPLLYSDVQITAFLIWLTFIKHKHM